MPKITNVTCDGCGSDISSTTNCQGYRLLLTVESLPNNGNYATLMAVRRPLKEDHYFCDISCLDLWTARRQHKDALWKNWFDCWKREHATVNEEGSVVAYTDSPFEIRDSKLKEFEALALKAFPMRHT